VTPDIIAKAHAILDGSARNDDARELARWVLERVAEETADTEPPPPLDGCVGLSLGSWEEYA
jgi:hypothetical protein